MRNPPNWQGSCSRVGLRNQQSGLENHLLRGDNPRSCLGHLSCSHFRTNNQQHAQASPKSTLETHEITIAGCRLLVQRDGIPLRLVFEVRHHSPPATGIPLLPRQSMGSQQPNILLKGTGRGRMGKNSGWRLMAPLPGSKSDKKTKELTAPKSYVA